MFEETNYLSTVLRKCFINKKSRLAVMKIEVVQKIVRIYYVKITVIGIWNLKYYSLLSILRAIPGHYLWSEDFHTLGVLMVWCSLTVSKRSTMMTLTKLWIYMVSRFGLLSILLLAGTVAVTDCYHCILRFETMLYL